MAKPAEQEGTQCATPFGSELKKKRTASVDDATDEAVAKPAEQQLPRSDGGRREQQEMALRVAEPGRGGRRGAEHPEAPPRPARLPGRARPAARDPAQPRGPLLVPLLPHRSRGGGGRRRRPPLR